MTAATNASIEGFSSLDLFVACPPGKVPLGGGANRSGPPHPIVVMGSSHPKTTPDGKNGWLVRYNNTGSRAVQATGTVYAVCAQVRP